MTDSFRLSMSGTPEVMVVYTLVLIMFKALPADQKEHILKMLDSASSDSKDSVQYTEQLMALTVELRSSSSAFTNHERGRICGSRCPNGGT